MSDESAAVKIDEEEVALEVAESEETKTEEAEGFEIVVSDDDTPSSQVMPVSAHIKAKSKWKQRDEQRQAEVTSKDVENELLRMQLKQLQTQQKPKPELKVPLEHEYDTPELFNKAMTEFVSEVGDARARKVVEELRETQTQTTTQAELEKKNDQVLDSYYARAEKLNAKDFSDAEDRVMQSLGKDAALKLIGVFDNSEAVVYTLGSEKHAAKLQYFSDLLKSDPVLGVAELTKFAGKVSLQPKTAKAPDPDDVEMSAGGATPDLQKQLERLREKHSKGQASMNDIIHFKRQAREKGHKLN